MSVNLGEEWGLLQKCSRFIANNLTWTSRLARGTPLSNDQKFTVYEIKKAGVATHLEQELPEYPEGQTEGAEHLRNLLQSLEDVIDDEVLELRPVEGGSFRKLKSIAQLLDSNEANLDRFLRPTEDDPTGPRMPATRFNEFMEHLSALEPAVSSYKQGRGCSKVEGALQLASQLQTLSRCLFETLVHNSSCCEGTGSHHIAKLQLLSPHTRWENDENNFSFHIFLCSRSDQEHKTWYGLTFNIIPNLPNGTQPYSHEESQLCRLIHECEETKQGLKIDFVNNGEGNAGVITNLEYRWPMYDHALPDISLASLIDNSVFGWVFGGGKFTPGEKAALLLTLAVPLVYLSRESWLRDTWRAEDIYFVGLPDPAGDEVHNVDHLYLSAPLLADVRQEAESNDLGLSNTCILSFALLMLEIQTGRRIPPQASLWRTVNDAVDGELRAYLSNDFRGAIHSCLNFRLQARTGIGNTTEEKTRDFVFRKIIKPLEDESKRWEPPMDRRRELQLGYKAQAQVPKVLRRRQPTKVLDPPSPPTRRSTSTKSDDESDSDETTSRASSVCSSGDAKMKKPRVTILDNPEESQNELEELQTESSAESVTDKIVPKAILYHEWDGLKDPNKEALANDFFLAVEHFNTKFIRSLPLDSSESLPLWRRREVRVAILDSGLKKTDPMISGAMAKHRIVGKRNWVGNDPTKWGDIYGHGTHVARCILRVAPRAKLYIAKISDEKEIPEDQFPAIGKAINYAINEWDVDIISMSLGLDEEHSVIEEALNAALKPKKDNDSKQSERIIFAAASNGGAGIKRAWPACKPGVICVNACDGHGDSINSLSPAAIRGEDNFVTLGMSIESLWERAEVFKSGTSFATPIAAALAANILEFARLKTEMNYEEKCWLHSAKGMRAVLRRLSVEVGGNYRFLCPWKGPEGKRLDSKYIKGQLDEAFKFDYFN